MKPALPKIELPGDRPTRLFVIAMATNLAIHHIHTADALDKSILAKDVQSFSEDNNPDLSFSRRLKYKQERYGKIRNIPTESRIKRPTNLTLAFIAAFSALGVYVYGQSNPTISAQATYILNYYWADLAVAILLVMGLLVYVLRRNKG